MGNTITVRMPDGTKVKNVPSGITQTELVRRYSQFKLQDQISAEEQENAATQRLFGDMKATSIGKQRSLLQKVAGAAPEVIGTTIGGILGIPGGIAGMGAGGAIGAAGGESLRQLLAASGIAPRTFGTLESTEPERIGKAGVFGGLTEAAGGLVTKVLPTAFLRKLSPIQARDVSLLEREGIPFSAGDIRPSGAAQQAENLLRGTLLGSKPATAFEQSQREAVVQFEKRILDKFGPMLSKEEVGEALQTAVKGRHQQLVGSGGIFERAYRRVSAIFPAKIDTASIRKGVEPIKKELDKLTAEGRIGAAAKSKETPSRFIDLVDRLAKFGTIEVPPKPASYILDAAGRPIRAATGATRKEISLTYADVWKDKQSLDALIRSMSADDPLRTKAKSVLKQLHSILDRAMEDAAQKVSPEAASRVRNINKAYAETKSLFEIDSPVAKIGTLDPERIVQKFFQPGATTPPKELLTALRQNPEILPPLRRRVAENLFEGLGKEVEGVRITPASQLQERILKSQDTLKLLFTPDQLQGLNEFVYASARAQASGRMMNPASGRQLLAMSQLGSAAQLATAGFFVGTGNLPGGAAAVFGPAVLSRALFNPKTARVLALGFTIKPGTAKAARWTVRAINAVRAVESQENTQKRTLVK